MDNYFSQFERVAITLNWAKDVWLLLLQRILTGKAREVFSALAIEQAKQYEELKATILHAYELVQEAYHQRFRNARKSRAADIYEICICKRLPVWPVV